MKPLASFVGSVWLLGAHAAWAQQPAEAAPARRTMTAERMAAEETVVVDGRLDEPIWSRAAPARDFMQQDPQNGAPETERTEVRIAYSTKALYMGVTCFDREPDRLLRFQRRRDEFLPADDRFMWVIDPFLSAQNGYFFETNPSGLMADSLISSSGQNRQWDGIWTLRVHRSAIGWTLEVEIPFSTLSFDPNGTAWGINFQRSVRRRNEEMVWNGWARNQGLFRLTNAGLLQGISGVTQGVGLDIRPYGLVSSEASPGTAQPVAVNEGQVGVDVFYSLTPGLRANLTINTDFAQTEVDQRLVNLTRFSLFFPEKRTFFLEGANMFDFATQSNAGGGFGGFTGGPGQDNSLLPFFSRTVGLDANGSPQRIDYGLKLFGQVGRQDIGVLHVRSAEEGGAAGVPAENVTVLRVKRRVLRQSYVGGIFTQRDAAGSASSALGTMGLDFLLATSRFRGSKNLSTSGFLLRTTNPRDTGKNAAFGIRMDYPNDRWNGGVSYRAIQENFTPALGFLLRGGIQRFNPYVNFSPRPSNHPFIRRLGFTANVDVQTDMQNRALTRTLDFTAVSVETHRQDNFNFHVLPQYERLDRSFRIYSGITLPAGREYSFVRYRLGGSTAGRRLIAVAPSVEWGDFFSGTRRQINLDVTLRARPGVILYLGTELNAVDLPEGGFQTRVFRATPELQFSQWMSAVNTLQYDSVSRVLGWQSRFRWILKPGNDIYFVYLHNWRDDISLDRFATLNRRAASKIIYTQRF